MSATTELYEEYEVRPLFQLGRAAMSSPDYSEVPLTHQGMILLLSIIEDRVYPPAPPSPPPPKARRARKAKAKP